MLHKQAKGDGCAALKQATEARKDEDTLER